MPLPLKMIPKAHEVGSAFVAKFLDQGHGEEDVTPLQAGCRKPTANRGRVEPKDFPSGGIKEQEQSVLARAESRNATSDGAQLRALFTWMSSPASVRSPTTCNSAALPCRDLRFAME